MKAVTGLVLLVGVVLLGVSRIEAADIVVYKSPTCGCCNSWIDHLKENGFTVEAHDSDVMGLVKTELGVPRDLRSCHTARVGNYIVEGHVPADLIAKMLKEEPAISGLAVPGMPMGSPGMEGHRNDPYDIISFAKDGKREIFGSRNQ